MACVQKIKDNIPQLLDHNNRFEGDGKERANKDIDAERTHLNYQLKKGSPVELNERLKHIYHIKRKNLVKMVEIVVTLPKDVKPEDEEKFFKAVYDYYATEDYGEQNIINASVHKDEFRPHIHIDAIPTIPIDMQTLVDDDRGYKIGGVERFQKEHPECTEMLCSKERINRYYLQTMHHKLSDFVTNRLGYEVEILNGATQNGRRTVLEMKNDRLEQEIGVLEKQRDSLKFVIDDIINNLANNPSLDLDPQCLSAYDLLKKLEFSQRECKALRDILKENGIKYFNAPVLQKIDSEFLVEMIRNQKIVYLNGDFTSPECKECDVLVVDLSDNTAMQKLPLTVQNYIQEEHILNEDGIYPISDNGVEYCLFVAHSQENIVHNLLSLKESYSDCTIAFPSLESDTYKFAERILPSCNFSTFYMLGSEVLRPEISDDIKKQFDEIEEKVTETEQEQEEYGDGEVASPKRKLFDMFNRQKQQEYTK